MAGEKNDQGTNVELTSSDIVRTPQEVRAMMKEASWLCKVFSGQYNMRVLALPGEGAWTCGIDDRYAQEVDRFIRGEIPDLDHLPPGALKPNLITVRENDFYRDPVVEIRRKTRHEAAHGTHSDYKLLFEGARRAEVDGFLSSSYLLAKNGPEDGWVNAMAAGESVAAMEDLRAGYTAKLAEITPTISQQPLQLQFGKNAINYWLTGRDFENLDPRVAEVTDRVRGALDRFFAARSATDNSQVFDEDIWPIIRGLEAEEIKDEQMRQVANQAMEQSSQQEQSQGQQGEGDQQSQNQQSGNESESKSGQQQPSGESSGEGEPSQQKESSGEEPGQQSSEGGQKQDLGEQIKNELEQGGQASDPGDEGEQSVDLSKLSADSRERLRQMIENMSEEEQKQLEQVAKEKVDEKQSENLDKEAPKVIQMEKDKETGKYRPKIQASDPDDVKEAEAKLEQFQKEETAREVSEMAEAQKQAEAQAQKEKAERERNEKLEKMRQEGFVEKEEADYDEYKRLEAEIEPQYQDLRREMQRLFPRKVEVQREGYFYSGIPNAHQAAREVPVGSWKFNEKKNIQTSEEISMMVWLVLDNSGSMAGDKMRESRKNIIMWSKLCEEFSIPCGVVTFNYDAEILKNPNQPFSAPQEKIKSKLIQKTARPTGGTNLSAAVETVNTELKNSRRLFPGMHGVALFVTDGEPTGVSGEPLIEAIDELKGSFACFAFGLGEGSLEQQTMQRLLSMYFGAESSVVPETFEELPRATAQVMNPILKRLSSQLKV